MEGTIAVVNDPRSTHPETREVIDKVIRGIEDLKVEGYDIRITFVRDNRITVDINPIGMSDDLIDLIKFLDNSSSGTLGRTGMSTQYFDGYFCQLFISKVKKAFPLDDYFADEKIDVDIINDLFAAKALPYTLVFKKRPFDNSGDKYYFLIGTADKTEE